MQGQAVGTKRNVWRAAALVAGFAVGAALLPSAAWICAWAVLLGLAGVALLAGERWRTGALMVAAVAIAVGLLNGLRRRHGVDAGRRRRRAHHRPEGVDSA
jgi:hypothetical protein